jgi:predicted flap endonuclease-1-like 5' DNA nuclease
MEGVSMMRWIIRLAAVGLAAALIGFLWSRANSDFEDEDFDEEIPLEFDVPLESGAAGAPAAVNDADTGEGPGANLDGAASAESGNAAPAAHAESGEDDLTLIRGIGPAFQKRLNDAGITTFAQLADADPQRLEADGIEGVGVDLASWIEQARTLAAGSAG